MSVARDVSSFSSFEGFGAPSRALNMLLIFSFSCLKVQPYECCADPRLWVGRVWCVYFRCLFIPQNFGYRGLKSSQFDDGHREYLVG